MSEEHEWGGSWDARMQGLEAAFGKSDETVLHATIPFQMGIDIGGSPDVVIFSDFIKGKLYVTADLLGDTDQKANSHGGYELAVAHEGDENWGVEIICALAYYTLDNVIEDGETMDIAEAAPEGSTLAALLFKRIASFNFQGEAANVMCVIGITKEELAFCFEKGANALLKEMPQEYIITDLFRESFV